MTFNGVNMGLGNIYKLSNAVTRSITAENVYGEKGKGGMADVSDTPQDDVTRIGQGWYRQEPARDLGRPWKVRPCITLPAQSTTTLMDVAGPGRDSTHLDHRRAEALSRPHSAHVLG